MARILILGAGYAGIRTAKMLAKSAPTDTQIDLVDKNDIHVEKMSLHEIAAGTASVDSMSFPIKDAIDNQKINFIQATVSRIDKDSKRVSFSDHEDMTYDYLVVGLGFRSENFGLPGADQYSLVLEDIPTAKKIYETIEKNVANYKNSNDPNDLNILVCGAGFTGVEILGELIDSTRKLKEKYNVPEINITCLEMATRILPMFDEELANYAVDYLKTNGINLKTGSKIKEIQKDGVLYDDPEGNEHKDGGNTIIWTVGVSGSDVIKDSGFDAKRNRVMVTDYLNIESNPEVFIIGDVSASMDPDSNRPYPTTAQLAIAQGDVVAENIVASIEGKPQIKFVYKSLGTIASLGQHKGIADMIIGGKHFKTKGYLASHAKNFSKDKSILEVSKLKIALAKGKL
ncbi:NAD(P)/FAD-dependent oxidoreductase [Companilactobacillus sp. DQM5]|uniref:NAD(P)/FAD-dependent oxidoreductase n=1 Tax=Companilactobacillus sp. DQM5 TaxID=3463359 RepID=UPI0040593CEE